MLCWETCGAVGGESMADEGLSSGPLEPAKRFPDEINELIANRQALQEFDADALAMRRHPWDRTTLPLGNARRRAGTQRLDFTVAGLAALRLVGSALRIFTTMSSEP